MKETDSCPGRQAWANVSLLLSPLPPLGGGGNWAHTSTILCLPKLVLKPVFLWDLSVHPPYPSPTLVSRTSLPAFSPATSLIGKPPSAPLLTLKHGLLTQPSQ